jgi:hypothetical protein
VTCDVILNTKACVAPPGSRETSIRSVCFACGKHACTSCSKIRDYLTYGKRRICNDCIEDMRPRT